jgi:hypothetical protein
MSGCCLPHHPSPISSGDFHVECFGGACSSLRCFSSADILQSAVDDRSFSGSKSRLFLEIWIGSLLINAPGSDICFVFSAIRSTVVLELLRLDCWFVVGLFDL